jgi:hypothetical protein
MLIFSLSVLAELTIYFKRLIVKMVIDQQSILGKNDKI